MIVHRDIDIYRALLDWQAQGQPTALATVLSTWGSAPRATGSILAINAQGEFVGSVSGGCVEGAVVRQARDAMAEGTVRELSFGVTDDEAFEVGLACGGTIRILVEPMLSDDTFVHECVNLIDARRSAVLIREIQRDPSGSPTVERRWGDVSDFESIGGARLEGDNLFVQPFLPNPRILIIGGVHIAQALVKLVEILDFEAILIDPRESWANAQRFPGVTIVSAWPEDVFTESLLDAGCAVVALTHDSKFDDPGLVRGLQSDAFYVGALGGRQTNKKRVDRFKALGLTSESIERLHAPIGLDIGASTPQEIALAIMAEIVARWRRK